MYSTIDVRCRLGQIKPTRTSEAIVNVKHPVWLQELTKYQQWKHKTTSKSPENMTYLQ